MQRVTEWVIRVVGFFHAHPATDPGDIIVMMQLEATLARVQAMVARQHKGHTDAKAARQLRNVLRKWVQQDLVRYLIAIGARASKDRADLAAKFRFPKANASIQVFLAARGDLRVVAQDLIELVRVLDGSNWWRFRKDSELRAQWDAVKSLPYKPAADVVVPPTEGGSSVAA